MLRQAQHERKNFNNCHIRSVHPEPVEGRKRVCSVQMILENYIDVYLPAPLPAEEVRRLEQALGERCNEILVETGLFIIGAVQDE